MKPSLGLVVALLGSAVVEAAGCRGRDPPSPPTPSSDGGPEVVTDAGIVDDAGPDVDGGPADGGFVGAPCIAPLTVPGEPVAWSDCPCSPFGVCSLTAIPQTGPLGAVKAFAEDDVWFAGTAGQILRFDGTKWWRLYHEGNDELVDIFAISPDDVWFFGTQSTAYRVRNGLFFEVDIGVDDTIKTSHHAHGASAEDFWVMGDRGELLHFDGEVFVEQQFPSVPNRWFSEVWAAAVDDVWAVGNEIFHYDGVEWSMVDEGFAVSVIGFASDDVYFLADGITHWDGGQFSSVSGVSPRANFWRLRGIGQNDLWAQGHHDGSVLWHRSLGGWTQTGTAQPDESFGGGYASVLWGLGGTDPDDVWAVGSEMGRFDGERWSWFWRDTAPLAVATTPDGVAWGITSESIVRDEGNGFEFVAPVERGQVVDVIADGARAIVATSSWMLHEIEGDEAFARTRVDVPRLHAIHSDGNGEAWAIGQTGAVARRIEGDWISVPTPGVQHLQDVFVQGVNDVWIVSINVDASIENFSTLLHWDGASFQSVELSGTVRRVWSASDDVWAVGDRTYHYVGGQWIDLGFRTWDVDGAGPDDVWLVGGGFSSDAWVARMNSSGAELLRIPFDIDLRSIAVLGPDDVCVLEYLGGVHCGGSQGFAPIESLEDIEQIWRVNGELWGIDVDGRLYRDLTGTRTLVKLRTGVRVNRVVPTTGEDVLFVGGEASARWDGERLTWDGHEPLDSPAPNAPVDEGLATHLCSNSSDGDACPPGLFRLNAVWRTPEGRLRGSGWPNTLVDLYPP